MNLQNKVCVVTGASSGIGKATAYELSRRGASLVLAARRAEELSRVAAQCRKLGAAECDVLPTDVALEGDCRLLIAFAEERFGSVDVLINNAGFGIFSRWADASNDELRAMFETNFFGAVYCTQAALPGMLKRRSGAIVNVASVAGLVGFPSMGGYCASKFALIGFSESLRNEVAGHGISVSAICPSTTRTEFFKTSGKLPGAGRLAIAMTPSRVARDICRAAERGTYRDIMPLAAAAFVRFKELAPRTAHLLLRKVTSIVEGRQR